MSQGDIEQQLRRLLRHIRVLLGMQVTVDGLMLYAIVKLLMANNGQVMLFWRYLTVKNGLILTGLLVGLDLCLMLVRRNDRLTGQGLISQLTGRPSHEMATLIRQFKRLK
ncbi:hypothetical protein [Secundilactobacillus similis]|uniref:Uncharacterized protein n=1 Tax=Secundilactobacillus similis DSM 23365 = JCM 2765 TaxID=1423804 RepID=A0A0R2EPH3_9LACO|nr:hypothetical protein [Secundilactobacillus similis]KRN18190.1 hypothetical protein FD14_GL002205 [Secundilactobacillus similis DSM 23365 = JCM 2765]